MQSSVNFNRKFQIVLFKAQDDGIIVPDAEPVVTDPSKMTFSYSVAPFAFNVCTFSFFNLDPFVIGEMSNGTKRGIILKCVYEGGGLQEAEPIYEEFFKGLIFKTNTYRDWETGSA